ncbi:MAG: ABC transporter ATP-binding protein [Treponema sp.]|nr:ABC transporter ATP-binding protein [Treponema sp.]
MNFLEFNDITFTYPPLEGDLDENGKQIIPTPVFEHFSAELPGGCFLSLVGQNGCGKSTFLMLASGRITPDSGSIKLLDKNPLNLNQTEKNLLASVIYQNMEFESDESVFSLLNQVYSSGALNANAKAIRDETKNLLDEVIDIFELNSLLKHGLTKLSKGEIQRVILAFSLLYGSASIFMDEPMFALEYNQKDKYLSYLKDFIKKTGTTIYCSMHELDLTKKYADQVLLFYPNRDMSLGTPEEVLTNEDLEKAYGIPVVMLKDKENLTRDQLKAVADQYSKQGPLN